MAKIDTVTNAIEKLKIHVNNVLSCPGRQAAAPLQAPMGGGTPLRLAAMVPETVTRYEFHAENFLGMVQLGCMKIMWRYL